MDTSYTSYIETEGWTDGHGGFRILLFFLLERTQKLPWRLTLMLYEQPLSGCVKFCMTHDTCHIVTDAGPTKLRSHLQCQERKVDVIKALYTNTGTDSWIT